MHLYPCVYLYFHATIIGEIIFNIILHTKVLLQKYQKYRLFLNFSFRHTIYPQLYIVPL